VVDAGQEVHSLRADVAALQTAEATPSPGTTVEQRVMVVGGGIAGMRAALSVAQRGVDVELVERAHALGGHFATSRGHAWDGMEPAELVVVLRKQVLDNPRIAVHLGAHVAASTPAAGHRDTVLRNTEGASVLVRHGATILATGGRGSLTTSYGYGTSDRILTQTDLEDRLEQGGLSSGKPCVVVMIQCVDAREKGCHDYCSRICCARALANAKRLRSAEPSARIFVLYRDMMTPGVWERDFTAARKSGVSFTPYDLDHKPEVDSSDGHPVVRVRDPVLNRMLELCADWVVLSTSIEPDPTNAELARLLDVELNPDGFFQEADAKWRPVDFAVDGVFVAGTAHGPQPARDVVAQAEAAAHRACSFLSRRVASTTGGVAEVHHALCARCGTCVEACAHRARRLDPTDRKIEVDPLRCRGCGVCTAACPNGATRLGMMGERQVIAALDAALEDVVFPSTRRRGGTQ
jgi:heterodisulfide reductase subunit A